MGAQIKFHQSICEEGRTKFLNAYGETENAYSYLNQASGIDLPDEYYSSGNTISVASMISLLTNTIRPELSSAASLLKRAIDNLSAAEHKSKQDSDNVGGTSAKKWHNNSKKHRFIDSDDIDREEAESKKKKKKKKTEDTEPKHVYSLKEEFEEAEKWIAKKKDVVLEVVIGKKDSLEVKDKETGESKKIDPGKHKFKVVGVEGNTLTILIDGKEYLVKREDLKNLEYVDLYRKLSDALVLVNDYNITGANGNNKVYFKNLIVPEKYKVSTTNVQPMWYIASLDKDIEGTSESGKKFSLKKGTKILVIKQSADENGYCKCVIQTGENKGEVITIKRSKLNFLQQITTGGIKYTKSTAERFINSRNIKSKTNYLVWINKNTQTFYVFEKENGMWKCIKRWNCATGSYQYSKACDYHNSFSKEIYRKQVSFQNIYRYMHYTSPGGSGIHGLLEQKKLGYPQSHQCIRLTSANRDWVWDNLPEGTRVVLY